MKGNTDIQKAVHDSVEVIKDSLVQTLMQYVVSAGEKGVRREDLPKLIAVTKASIEQSYHNSARNLDKVIEKALDKATSEASSVEKPVKKK